MSYDTRINTKSQLYCVTLLMVLNVIIITIHGMARIVPFPSTLFSCLFKPTKEMLINIGIIEKMFNWDGPVDRTKKLAHALTHPVPPVEISQSEAPAQEHVITDDLDVNKWITAIRHTNCHIVWGCLCECRRNIIS